MKKIFAALFILLLVLFASTVSVFAETSEDGTSFNVAETYFAKDHFSQLPSTIEATVYFPSSVNPASRGGVILGNYTSSGNACLNFEIHTQGHPRLYMTDENGKKFDFTFQNATVYTGKQTHVAIVKDSAKGQISCYINGELKQTISATSPFSIDFTEKMSIGGDLRSGNAQYFKGKIKNVMLYSDVRTAEEIAVDCLDARLEIDNLLGYYDLSTKSDVLSDENGVGPDFSINLPWADDYVPVEDYAYSFAVLGDIQSLTLLYPDKLSCIYDWIVDNIEEKKIKFVFGLGDITDDDTVREWNLAKSEMKKMDLKVPYSVVRGNHDSVKNFNKYFSYEEFGDFINDSFEENLLNTYQKFSVGNTKYLVFCFDIGPSDEVLEWASSIIEKNKDHNVIITTHIYLSTNGNTSDGTKKYSSGNTGEMMWEKLVKKHENMVLVLSGHHPTNKVVMSERIGDNGNKVTQMLIDPQVADINYGGLGMVAMLYFSEDGKKVDVEYYSTVRDKYFMNENQFSIELDTLEAEQPENEVTGDTADVTEAPSDVTEAPSENENSADSTQQIPPKNNSYILIGVISVAAVVILAIIIKFSITRTKKTSN